MAKNKFWTEAAQDGNSAAILHMAKQKIKEMEKKAAAAVAASQAKQGKFLVSKKGGKFKFQHALLPEKD